MDFASTFDDQTLLVTGGTGSFGRNFVAKVLRESNCKKVIVFSRDEWKQWDMRRSNPIFDDPRIRYFLGDVRDKERLMRAFKGVNLVVHAAALKQVPAAEYNPSEFVKTNVLGAMNVIDAAIHCGVRRVIALSTDKAVNPINLYGATKLCSDKLFVSGNIYAGADDDTRFAVVRYGNVLGSRGSIIPLWRQMLAEGAEAVTITDERMTRFWVTLEQAVDFVAQCFGHMHGGEIFIPKIPSMRIPDLAEAIAPGVPQKVIGIREGEKLHELLLGQDDARHSFEFPTHYVIAPELLQSHRQFEDDGGTPLAEDFIYASNTNRHWLGVEALREIVGDPTKPAPIVSPS